MRYLPLLMFFLIGPVFAGKNKVEEFKFFKTTEALVKDFYEVKLEEKDSLGRTNLEGLDFGSEVENGQQDLEDFCEIEYKIKYVDISKRTDLNGLEFGCIETNEQKLLVLRSKTDHQIFATSTLMQEKESQI